MAFTLPSSPTVGQIVSTPTDRYIWDGSAWSIISTLPTLPSAFVSAGNVTIGGTTTAPTKPATRVIDRVRYRQVAEKTFEIEYKYAQNIQGTGGSGDHLFSLPAGLQFDLTLHPIYTGPNNNHLIASYSLPFAYAEVHIYGNNHAQAVVIPYNATQFRLWCFQDLSGARHIVNSVNYGINTIANVCYNIQMTITTS